MVSKHNLLEIMNNISKVYYIFGVDTLTKHSLSLLTHTQYIIFIAFFTETMVTRTRINVPLYRGADKSLARSGKKQATATEDFEFHISYL
jgi:hypothetical protein